MTKIDQINETVAIPTTKRQNTSALEPFSASLENALSRKITGTADRGQTSALGEPQSPIISRPGASSPHVVEQTDRLLELLESYATGLEKPGTTLKELASIVTLMKDEAMQLMTSANTNAVGRGGINSIAAKAALTANVEYIKFHRGDYI